MVEEDLPADVREHRPLDVRLDILLRGRVVLADAEETHELVDVAAAHDEDADCNGGHHTERGERTPDGQSPQVGGYQQHRDRGGGQAEPAAAEPDTVTPTAPAAPAATSSHLGSAIVGRSASTIRANSSEAPQMAARS